MIEAALATFRLVKLAKDDAILDGPREQLHRWAVGPTPMAGIKHPKVTTLMACPWCLSIWAAAIVLILGRLPGGRKVVQLLALSAAAALIEEKA